MDKPKVGEVYEVRAKGTPIQIEIVYVNQVNIFYVFVGHYTTNSISFEDWARMQENMRKIK